MAISYIRNVAALCMIALAFGCGGGDNGSDGTDGESGVDGDNGANGADGQNGTDGTDGQDGANGTDGQDGANGTDGQDGADGANGQDGQDGQDGVSAAILSGTVAANGSPLADATLTFDPDVLGEALTTDANGEFSSSLPVGVYDVTVEAEGYDPFTTTVSIAAGVDATLDVTLDPTAGVVVDAGEAVSADAGGDVTLGVDTTVYDGSTVSSVSWTQVSGVPLTITDEDTETPTVTLADTEAYKEALVSHLTVPDRTMVLGINPFALEEAEMAVFEVTVTTDTGSYTSEVEVAADLGLAWTTGLPNVPTNVAVLLQAAEDATNGYAWTVTGPSGAVAVDDATSRYPIFVPTAAGEYTVTETNSGATLVITAGEWVGAISGVNETDGLPDAADCTMCHNGSIAPDMFTEWRASGHAEIFSQNIDDPANHWSTGCAACHGVGYNEDADNGGWDEAMADEGWEKPAGAPGAYAAMFDDYPETASLANIQCENCHGPNGTGHNDGETANRVSMDSAVCGSCHGEPLRHGRFQQWQESAHSNYATAISRGTRAACSGCHEAAGFVAWLATGDVSVEATTAPATAETAHPITCATCHDPHSLGNATGEPNDAVLRVQGSSGTVLAGYNATGFGNGALCVTCHNSRRGVRNDSTGVVDYQGPHHGTQGDVLMGKNFFFVTGSRAAHSFIDDTCTNCHMRLTDPPEEYSYQLGGTNHSFEASLEICSNCHGNFSGEGVQAATSALLTELAAAIDAGALAGINAAGANLQVVAIDPATGNETAGPVALDGSLVTSAAVTIGHAFELELTLSSPQTFTVVTGDDPVTTEDVTLDVIDVELAGLFLDAGVTPVFSTDSNLAKACWNAAMITEDGSLGVHSPGFVVEVLESTLAQDLSN